MNEIWYSIPGYEGLYEISDKLNVRSIRRNHVLKQQILIRHGLMYRFVTLFKDRRKRTAYIHRIVALTFIPNPLGKNEVDHIDGNSLNNTITNLRWCTSKENGNNPITRLRRSMSKGMKVNLLSAEGNVLNTYHSIREASRQLDVSITSIKRVCRGIQNSAKGHYFAFA